MTGTERNTRDHQEGNSDDEAAAGFQGRPAVESRQEQTEYRSYAHCPGGKARQRRPPPLCIGAERPDRNHPKRCRKSGQGGDREDLEHVGIVACEAARALRSGYAEDRGPTTDLHALETKDPRGVSDQHTATSASDREDHVNPQPGPRPV